MQRGRKVRPRQGRTGADTQQSSTSEYSVTHQVGVCRRKSLLGFPDSVSGKAGTIGQGCSYGWGAAPDARNRSRPAGLRLRALTAGNGWKILLACRSRPRPKRSISLPAEIRRLQTGLLAWYRQHQRQLPWRESQDVYPIWVSEVMLQQTQVQTVVPYFLRFMAAFPTLEELARADTQDLLRCWAGLGYYSRARNLRQAARILVREHGGEFPRSYREALRLPGIGPYTAAAILSIAFDQPLLALDGNVVRVLARLFPPGGRSR